MIFVHLFLVFFRISLFAIGGAYSFLPLVEEEVVLRHHWLSKEEFLDITGVTQVFPGAISIKYATYIGYKMAGLPGVIISNIGNSLAPIIFIILATVFYRKYNTLPILKGAFNAIRLSVFAMIVAVAFQATDLVNLMQVKNILIVVSSFALFIFTKTHPAIIIILTGLLGIVWR